ENQRFVGYTLKREPEGDLLSVVRVLLGRPGAVTELENLRRTCDEEVGRRSLDAPQPRGNHRVSGGKPGPDRVVDQVVGHEAGDSGGTTGDPSSLGRSASPAMPSIIAPFCFEAISRRSARSRTARFDCSPVSALARSMSCGSKSTLVTAITTPHSVYMCDHIARSRRPRRS